LGQADEERSRGSVRRLVPRPRLLNLLDETLSRRIVLVAPAGYGKTTLARQWLGEEGRRGVWYRATSASTDVAALALGLADAAEELRPGAGGRLHEHLRKSRSPNAEADRIGRLLREDLADWPAEAWVVIDDYHNIAQDPDAERFIDAVMDGGVVPLLVTSRVRPAWVSAKSLLYGEVAELGRNVLAMTHEEAAMAVPRHQEPGSLAGLVALAEGWPAVIGLASLVQAPALASNNEIPEALHSYFAEELYQEIEPQLQWNLIQLSLAPTIDEDLASVLFGARSDAVLEQAYERGFLNREGEAYDLHPLLRHFLRSKLLNANPDAKDATIEAIARTALDRCAWDEVFAIVTEFHRSELLRDLLAKGLDDLLATGRLATLERWIDEAARVIPGAESAALAEVELAFRKTRWAEAESKARHLAERLPEQHPMASRVLFRAAQVAQLDDRSTEALELLSEARARATSSTDLRRAAWSRFIALTDIEAPELAAEALRELEALPPESVEDTIRLSHGPLHFAVRWGGIRRELERQNHVLALLDQSDDPVVRSGFLQTYATALSLAARYAEAYEVADRQLIEAKRFGLDWVSTHGLELKALTQIGLRDFRGARASLRTAWKLAAAADDFHSQVNATALLARIPLAQGAPEQALELLDSLGARSAGPGMEGEVRSIRALALASTGAFDEAESEIQASQSLSTHLEARGLRAYARALVADRLGEHDRSKSLLQLALRESYEAGNADSFVVAYRLAPELLQTSVSEAIPIDDFLLRAVRTYDPKTAERVGLTPAMRRVISTSDLTAREEEVLALVQQGLSNRQIAQTLWIAESTTKVHVRHIFEKLGVRTRTEAALFRSED
jgi:LuxR family transcriptional regulator, maltose regulon positive regulatory protein